MTFKMIHIYIIYKVDVPVCFLIEDKIEKNSRMAYDLLRMTQNYHDSDYTQKPFEQADNIMINCPFPIHK